MPCDLILALDAPSPRALAPALRALSGTVRWAKVGLEMFTACGPDCTREIADLGFDVFLDLKLHDIPNTVAKSVESAGRLPVKMLTIHASGGLEMMRAAARAREQNASKILLLGVTVLTSLGDRDLAAIGIEGAAADQVTRLGGLAIQAGLGGLVCSPREIAPLRAALPPGVKLVAPGIRPRGAQADDQTRVMTPAEAAREGADFIVVGRPVFGAADPVAAARAIVDEMRGKL